MVDMYGRIHSDLANPPPGRYLIGDAFHCAYPSGSSEDSSLGELTWPFPRNLFTGYHFRSWVFAGEKDAYGNYGIFSDPMIVEGQVTYSKAASDDMPGLSGKAHGSADLNFFIYPDEQYRWMLASPGNFKQGEPNELGRIEVEWEKLPMPTWALPMQGDWVHVEGAFIFDCSHWAEGYRTEIHPPRLIMTLRDAAKDSYGGARGYRPGWASILPKLGSYPVQTTRADIFASSDGGLARKQETCFDADCSPYDWYQPLADRDYHLFVPAPPKPDGDYKMIYDIKDKPLPSNTMTRFMPTIEESTDPNKPGVYVHINFKSNGFNEATTNVPYYYGVGINVTVGWNKRASTPPRRVRVTIDKFHVDNPLDGEFLGGFLDGEWSLSAVIGDQFRYLLTDTQNNLGTPYKDEIEADHEYNLGESFDVTLLPGQPLRIFIRGVEMDNPLPLSTNDFNLFASAGCENDDIGVVEHIFTESDNYGIGGSYTEFFQWRTSAGGEYLDDECPPCGSVTFRIEDNPYPPPPATSLTIGEPKFILTDTTWVTKNTDITLSGVPSAGHESDQLVVHYQLWRTGISEPTESTCVSSCIANINANDGKDGEYTLGYWTEDKTNGIFEPENKVLLYYCW